MAVHVRKEFDNTWLFIKLNKKRVGYCIFSCVENTCKLWSFTIKERFRRQGYGRKLFDLLLEHVHDKNVLELVVLGGKSNLEMMSLIKNLPVLRCDENINFYQLKI